MKSEITGNRDASYSTWHRNTLTRKHTNVDNDLLEMTDQTVYTMYYNFDSDGDLVPRVIFETKGIIYDPDDEAYILPDLSKFITQMKALRGTAKIQNLPAFFVFYYIENDRKFFVVVPINETARKSLQAGYLAVCMSEHSYVKFLYKLSGISDVPVGMTYRPEMVNFKCNKFERSLQLIPK
jgi:hypothetical protein